MTLLVVSFIAGVLTVLAPCILPALPVIIGSSATGRSRLTPYIVVGSTRFVSKSILEKAGISFVDMVEGSVSEF